MVRGIVAWWLSCLVLTPAYAQVSEERVDAAMAAMRRYLYATQDPRTGGWPQAVYASTPQAGGDTALVVLALLQSGESFQDARLARAIELLRGMELKGTYAVSLRAHVWAQLPDAYRPQLEADARWLLAAADAEGRFRYAAGGPAAGTNHSTTHYGLLGVWEAAKRGAAVPPDFWQRSEKYLLRARDRDGAWGYQPGTPAYGSMTAAGLTGLLIAQAQGHRQQPRPDAELAPAIRQGMRWLDTRFSGAVNPGSTGWPLYYLYSVERVGLASGARFLNGQDWFDEGARYILEQIVPEGGDPAKAGSVGGGAIDTAFALLFLARGRVPVWISKLLIPGQVCDNHPNDAASLTAYLSDLHEGELNWHAFSLDVPAERWLSPVVFLASDEPLRLSEEQKANLKRYLDLGGLLLANADNGSERFAASVRGLATELYPRWPMRRLPADHLIYNALRRVPDSTHQPIFGVSNGARELILLPGRDWGFAFQADAKPGESAAWGMAVNLWALATDRGLLPNRLAAQRERPGERDPTDAVRVGRAHYHGDWLPEPASWASIEPRVYNRAGLMVETEDLDLVDLADSSLPLVHLAGIEPAKLSEEELTAIAVYAQRGGTLLVETVGGRGGFTRGVESQLVELLNAPSYQILGEEPVISGRGLQGGYDNRAVSYRRFAAMTMGGGSRPRLAAILFNGRPGILLSREDLSLGGMGVGHWGIMGYTPESSKRLLTNIVLAAHDARRAESGGRGPENHK